MTNKELLKKDHLREELLRRWYRLQAESDECPREERLKYLSRAIDQFSSDELKEIARIVTDSETNQIEDTTDDTMSPDELREWWENLVNSLHDIAEEDKTEYCNKQFGKLSISNIRNLARELGLSDMTRL